MLRQDCTWLAQQGRAIPTFKTRDDGMPVAPAQYEPVVLNLLTEGNQIQIYDFVREPH